MLGKPLQTELQGLPLTHFFVSVFRVWAEAFSTHDVQSPALSVFTDSFKQERFLWEPWVGPVGLTFPTHVYWCILSVIHSHSLHTWDQVSPRTVSTWGQLTYLVFSNSVLESVGLRLFSQCEGGWICCQALTGEWALWLVGHVKLLWAVDMIKVWIHIYVSPDRHCSSWN